MLSNHCPSSSAGPVIPSYECRLSITSHWIFAYVLCKWKYFVIINKYRYFGSILPKKCAKATMNHVHVNKRCSAHDFCFTKIILTVLISRTVVFWSFWLQCVIAICLEEKHQTPEVLFKFGLNLTICIDLTTCFFEICFSDLHVFHDMFSLFTSLESNIRRLS